MNFPVDLTDRSHDFSGQSQEMKFSENLVNQSESHMRTMTFH